MSTDWNVVCGTCNVRQHLGQHMAARNSFGFGPQDEEGRRWAADFIEEHLGHDLRILDSEAVVQDIVHFPPLRKEVQP